MIDSIRNGIKDVLNMHSSAAPARVEGLCDVVLRLVAVIEEIKTQLAEEQETLDEIQEKINEWEEVRRRKGSSTLASLKAAHRNSKGDGGRSD